MSKFLMAGHVDLLAAAESTAPRSFNVKAYTGGKLRVKQFPQPIIVDLAGLQAADGIPVNLDHDPSQRVGHINELVNDGRTLLLTGVISATGDAAKEFESSAVNQFPWQASIEALPVGVPQQIQAGQSVQVNGQTFTGPVLVSRTTILRGVAFLSRPADAGTKVSLAAGEDDSNFSQGVSMSFEDWVKSLGLDPATVSEDQKKQLQAAYDAMQKPAEEPVVTAGAFDLSEIQAASSDHVSSLELIYGEYENVPADKMAEIRAAASKKAKEIKASAIKSKWTPAQFESELKAAASDVHLSLMRADRPAGPAIHASQTDMNATVIEAALCQAVSLPGIEKHYDEKTLQAAHTAYRGRIGLGEVLIMAAAMNGYVCRPGVRVHAGNLRELLNFAFPRMIQAAGFSTLSLPGIFSNVGNKELLQGYNEEDQTWRRIAAIKPVSDFKQVTSYRMLDNLEYEELSPDGRITHGTLGEETYTRQAKTYAKMGALTRADFINDDLGAFEDMRTRLGRGAAKKFNNLFWKRFMDNAAFFTSGRGNYITGSTTNLGTDGVGLQLALTAFRKLRTPAADGSKRLGNVVGGRPEIALVPPELEFTAGKLHASSNIANVKADEANIHAGKYEPVVCDWLSDANFTGYSPYAWYLLRNPSNAAAVVASFLDGQQSPTVEQADADFDQLGVQFRGYHDFGVDFAEYLCGVKVKGEA